MLEDILAKSVRSDRRSGVLGNLGEDFDFAARTLHYPLTPEVRFSSIKELRTGIALSLKQLRQDKVKTLSIHGHGTKYSNGVAIEMGDDILHHSTVYRYAVELKKIGEMMAQDGHVIFLHCFAGAAKQLMPQLTKLLGVPVSGEVRLNNLSPALTPIQNLIGVGSQKMEGVPVSEVEKIVGAGMKTYLPSR